MIRDDQETVFLIARMNAREKRLGKKQFHYERLSDRRYHPNRWPTIDQWCDFMERRWQNPLDKHWPIC